MAGSSEPGPDSGLSRRDLLRKVSLGGAVFLGGSVLGHTVQHAGATAGYPALEPGHEGMDHESLYGHLHTPPAGVGPGDLDARTFPPPRFDEAPGAVREVEIAVEERLIEVGSGAQFEAWTYNGTVPGPILRANEGDTLRIAFDNRTGNPHNIHFHGAHRPEQDGWEPVPPGGGATYEILAGPAGVHPYHCHTSPLAGHLGKGLYGMMIVDPPGGRSPAQEVALLLSGFSSPTLGANGVVAWNGIAGYYNAYPIKVAAGEPVRAYLVNMVEDEPVASFHLHAETFEVFPGGMGERPAFREDTVSLAQAQRAIVEFTLPHLGRYMFHPHQHWLADRGAMGWFAAV